MKLGQKGNAFCPEFMKFSSLNSFFMILRFSRSVKN